MQRGHRVTAPRPHRDRAALARIALARYAAPEYVAAIVLIRIDGGDSFVVESSRSIAEACAEVAEREEMLAALAGEPA